MRLCVTGGTQASTPLERVQKSTACAASADGVIATPGCMCERGELCDIKDGTKGFLARSMHALVPVQPCLPCKRAGARSTATVPQNMIVRTLELVVHVQTKATQACNRAAAGRGLTARSPGARLLTRAPGIIFVSLPAGRFRGQPVLYKPPETPQ